MSLYFIKITLGGIKIMGIRLGSGFIGTDQIKATVGVNEEIIPTPPVGSGISKYMLYRFSFHNPNQACSVKVNGSDPIYLEVGEGFNTDPYDAEVWSFIVVETAIDYHFIGGY